MEVPLHIVGCVLASRPAQALIDAFIAQARRERAVVMAKSAQAATFVRFAAADARLVAAACRAVGGQAPGVLRFGFAAGVRDVAAAAGGVPTAEGVDDSGLNISTRSIVLANDLAAGAADGEVLASPPLAMALLEVGFGLVSRQVNLPGGRSIAACALELLAEPAARPGGSAADGASARGGGASEGSPSVVGAPSHAPTERERAGLLHQSGSLADGMRALAAQAAAMAARQEELEARQDAVLAKMTLVDQGSLAARHLAEMEAELEVQVNRVAARLAFVDEVEQRLARSQSTLGELERNLATQLSLRSQTEGLASLCDTLAARTDEAMRQLAGVSDLQQRLLPMVAQVAALTEALDGADEKAAALEQRRRLVDEVHSRAEAITHMVGDMQLQLELLGEQRAEIDHVGERLARLDFSVQEAQSTLRGLQREREMAELVSQGLKALRSRG